MASSAGKRRCLSREDRLKAEKEERETMRKQRLAALRPLPNAPETASFLQESPTCLALWIAATVAGVPSLPAVIALLNRFLFAAVSRHDFGGAVESLASGLSPQLAKHLKNSVAEMESRLRRRIEQLGDHPSVNFIPVKSLAKVKGLYFFSMAAEKRVRLPAPCHDCGIRSIGEKYTERQVPGADEHYFCSKCWMKPKWRLITRSKAMSRMGASYSDLASLPNIGENLEFSRNYNGRTRSWYVYCRKYRVSDVQDAITKRMVKEAAEKAKKAAEKAQKKADEKQRKLAERMKKKAEKIAQREAEKLKKAETKKRSSVKQTTKRKGENANSASNSNAKKSKKAKKT